MRKERPGVLRERFARPACPRAAGKARDHEVEHLFQGIAGLTRQLLPGPQRLPSRSALLHPRLDKRSDVGREVLPTRGASGAREFPEVPQDRHAVEDIPRGVALLGEPGDVALDGLPDPRGPDLIEGLRTNEVPLQHRQLSLPGGSSGMAAYMMADRSHCTSTSEPVTPCCPWASSPEKPSGAGLAIDARGLRVELACRALLRGVRGPF